MKQLEVEEGEAFGTVMRRLKEEAPAFVLFQGFKIVVTITEVGRKAIREEQAWNSRREEILKDLEASGIRQKYPWTERMGVIWRYTKEFHKEVALHTFYYGLRWLELNPIPEDGTRKEQAAHKSKFREAIKAAWPFEFRKHRARELVDLCWSVGWGNWKEINKDGYIWGGRAYIYS